MASILTFRPDFRTKLISTLIESMVDPRLGFDVEGIIRKVIVVGPDGTGKTTFVNQMAEAFENKYNHPCPTFHHNLNTGISWYESMGKGNGFAASMEGDLLSKNWYIYDRHPAIDYPVYEMATRGGCSFTEDHPSNYPDRPYSTWFMRPVVRSALRDSIVVFLRDQKVKPSAERGDPDAIVDCLDNIRKEYSDVIDELIRTDDALTWSHDVVIFEEVVS